MRRAGPVGCQLKLRVAFFFYLLRCLTKQLTVQTVVRLVHRNGWIILTLKLLKFAAACEALERVQL